MSFHNYLLRGTVHVLDAVIHALEWLLNGCMTYRCRRCGWVALSLVAADDHRKERHANNHV